MSFSRKHLRYQELNQNKKQKRQPINLSCQKRITKRLTQILRKSRYCLQLAAIDIMSLGPLALRRCFSAGLPNILFFFVFNPKLI